MLERSAPALFVLVWSSGVIVARLAVPHAAPQLILLLRMALTATALGGAALVARDRWPPMRRAGLHLVAGGLLNGVYLCASWWAVGRGMPAGIMSLLGALQPLAVAVGAALFLGERLPGRGWAGLGIGLAGVLAVLAPLLGAGVARTVPVPVVIGAAAAVLAMAGGTIVQAGALAGDGLRVSGAVQNAGGAFVALVATAWQGDYRWDGAAALWLCLGWSVLMLSVGALSLLVWMTRHQGPTRVSVLLLLVPPLAAAEARLLFGEHLSALQILGFAAALGGVLLTRTAAARRRGAAA